MLTEAEVKSRVGLPEDRKRWAFIPSVVIVVVGFCIELGLYIQAAETDFVMKDMHGTGMAWMNIGMVVMGAGLILGCWSLFPSIREIRRRKSSDVAITADDSQQFTTFHWVVVIGMALAITIDFMKAITLGFTLPGFKGEYGLTTGTASLLVLAGIGGTAVGSVFWGWMADRVGRRSTLLFTSLIFLASSSCGVMMPWQMNVFMCGLMGLASGGLLPVALAFLAEVLPSRHRGWLMVIIGGQLAVAYAATSWLATWLTPDYTWRMLWLVGAPLSLILITVSYILPESPRYLLGVGQVARAGEVMQRYGMKIKETVAGAATPSEATESSLSALGSRKLIGRTTALAMLGLSAGLVNYGFILWLPVNLEKFGISADGTNKLLAQSSLVSLPAIIIVAVLYNRWSSKKTMILACGATALALITLVLIAPQENLLLQGIIVIALCGSGALYATLGPYAAEMYPTYLRSAGTGVAQGWGKIGGVIGPLLIVATIAPPGLVSTAVLALIPTGLAAIAVWTLTKETRGKSLAELGAA